MPIRAQKPPAEQQSTPYLPAGPDPLVMEQFAGINTSTTRPGVKNEEMAWCDGMFPIGPRELRTLYGVGPQLWSVSDSSEPAGTTITFYGFANIGATPMAIVFLSNGSIYRVSTETGLGIIIAAAATINDPSRTATDMTQWGDTWILIVSKQTNGYFIYDGTTFYAPGDTLPNDEMVPTGLGGNAIETYSGRVWVADGSAIFFSAPGSINDFSSDNGGGEFVSSDSFLRVRFTALRQSNGFLYLIGDSSLNYISGVQTSGDPLITTFTNQNADPETGSSWPGSVTVFGRDIIFANDFGVQVSYGAAVTKVSEPLDGIYNSIPNFGGLIPSAAKAIIFGKKVWLLLHPIIDPITGQPTNKLFIWINNKLWVTSEQDVILRFIQHQEINSILTAWGTDNTAIYPLFQQPSVAVKKVVQSRLWDTPVGYHALKTGVRLWGLVQYFSADSINLSVSIDNENSSADYTISPIGGIAIWTATGGITAHWTATGALPVTWFVAGNAISVFPPTAVGQAGVLLGMTLTTFAADMALISMMLQPEDAGYRG